MDCDRCHTIFRRTKLATSRMRTGTDRYIYLCDSCLAEVQERYTIPLDIERFEPLPCDFTKENENTRGKP